MAVLIEGISVLVRCSAIDEKMPGGWERFKLLVPNQTLCTDRDLARVGFLDPSATGEFIDELTSFGLIYLEDGKAEDIIVCDQQRGPVIECEWIEFGKLKIDGGKISAAWLWTGPRIGHGLHMPAKMNLAVPDGWVFKDSLSDKFMFRPDEPTN